jgi:hypothetical protein
MVSRRCLAFIPLLVMLADAPAKAQTEFEGVREHHLKLLGAQLKADQFAAAQDSLRAYLDEYPGDATMRYNLACLVALDGDIDHAITQLETALADGYRDLAHLSADPDLAALRSEETLVASLEELEAELTAAMHAGGVSLTEGRWSEPQLLTPDPKTPGSEAPSGDVMVRYDPDDLELAIEPAIDDPGDVIVTIAWPQSLEEFETTRWFEYAAELRDGASITLVARDGQVLRRIDTLQGAERDPVASVRRADGRWHLAIPWESLTPNRPPIELLVGLNVTVRRAEPAPAARWSLIRDVFAGSETRQRRTFVPVTLDPGSEPVPFLTGRLDRYLAVGDTISAELGAQGIQGGDLEIDVAVTSGDATWDTTQAWYADPELSYATVLADLSALPHGWFELTATIRGDASGTLTWRDRGYRLAPSWFVERHARFEELPEVEKPLVQYHLFRVLRGQQSANPTADPSRIAASVVQTDVYLDRWRLTGTVLPEAAAICAGAFSLNEDSLHPCLMVLPAESDRQGGDVTLVLTDEPALNDLIAREIHDGRKPEDRVVYVVASAPTSTADPRSGAGIALRAREWAEGLFTPAAVRLIGLGTAAESALRVASIDPAGWSSLLLLADQDFDPWVLSAPSRVTRMLAMTLGDLPIQLVLPASPSPRARAVTTSLEQGLSGLTVTREDVPAFGTSEIIGWIHTRF